MANAKEMLHQVDLNISITIPFWIDRITEAFPNARPLNYEVIDIADEVVVMTYTIYRDRIEPYAESSLIYAAEHQTSIKIALEMVENSNKEITFYDTPEAIKEIITMKLDYLSFDGYVIHTLDAFGESGIKVEYKE